MPGSAARPPPKCKAHPSWHPYFPTLFRLQTQPRPLPQLCPLAFRYQLSTAGAGAGMADHVRLLSPHLEPLLAGVAVTAMLVYRLPGRASASPGRGAANTIHPAGASSHASPACPWTRGRAQSRGCWARGKYSHTTVVTDFLYKQPEGSFLTLLSSCPVREGVWRKGRLELIGTEPGPGLGGTPGPLCADGFRGSMGYQTSPG